MVGGALVAASSALGQLSQSGVVFQPTPGSTDTFSGTFQVSYPTQPTQGATTFPVTGDGGFVTFFTQTGTSPILQGNPPQVTGGRIYSTQSSWARPLDISSETTTLLQDGALGNTVTINGVSQTVFKRSVSTSYVLALPVASMPVGESNYKVVLVSGDRKLVEAPLTISSPIGDQTVAEGTLLSVNLAGIDASLGAQSLTYTKIAGPDGLSVTSAGVLTWTPTEAQGPSSNPVKVSVSGTASGGGTINLVRSFNVIVTEVNNPPSLGSISDLTVDEGTELKLSLSGSDSDIPPQALTYKLVSGPNGLRVSQSGAITWTPTEDQGPGVFTVVVRVSDGSLSAIQAFKVGVKEVNTAPEFDNPNPETQSVQVGKQFTAFARASDSDKPLNELVFKLEQAPGGMELFVAPVLVGGVQTGKGATLVWNSTGSSPGEIPVVLSVSDGVSKVSKSWTVKVKAAPTKGKKLKGKGLDGYLNGALVFFDANLNGVLDGDEPSTLTDRQGDFDLEVDLDVFDTNANGELDSSEGRLVLQGGIDMSTGTESTAVLIAPAGSTVVTPLTTIVESVLRADPTLTSVADAETIVKAALGLPEVEITKFDPFKAVTEGGTNALAAVQLQSIAAQVSDTIQQLTAVVTAAADGKVSDQAITAAVVQTVVASIVDANDKGVQVDLASKDTVLAKVEKVATETGVAISAEVKATVAEVISASNELKQRVSETAEFDAVQALVEIAMTQTVSQVKAVEALTSLANGLISADDVLDRFTGDALETRVSEAPKADFLAVDTRPGTFRIVSKSALVSESGVNYEPLMVKREDGAFGNVNVRLVFAASSRLKQNVVEFTFRDGEIVRTLNPSDVLVDDEIPQSNEDFVVELKLAADAPQGALLGGQDSATLRVIDNDVAGSVGFEASSFEVREGGPATKPVVLVREGGLAGTIRVNVASSSGTAVVGQDLSAGAILVEFLPGQRRKVVDLGIVDDVIVEGTEDFTVSLTLDPSTATGSALTQGSTVATVGILDNDVAVDTRLEARMTATGAVRLRAWGTVGIKHRLEASTDLKTWAPVGNSTFKTAGAVSAVEILTENPVAAGKFLRLVEVP